MMSIYIDKTMSAMQENQSPQNQSPQNQSPQNQSPQNQSPQNQSRQNQYHFHLHPNDMDAMLNVLMVRFSQPPSPVWCSQDHCIKVVKENLARQV